MVSKNKKRDFKVFFKFTLHLDYVFKSQWFKLLLSFDAAHVLDFRMQF